MKWLLIAVAMYGSNGTFTDDRSMEVYAKVYKNKSDCIIRMHEIQHKRTPGKEVTGAYCVKLEGE